MAEEDARIQLEISAFMLSEKFDEMLKETTIAIGSFWKTLREVNVDVAQLYRTGIAVARHVKGLKQKLKEAGREQHS